MDWVRDELKRLRNGASIEDAEDREVWRALVDVQKNGAWVRQQSNVILRNLKNVKCQTIVYFIGTIRLFDKVIYIYLI